MSTKTTDLVYAGASLRERQEYALALSKAGELIPRGLRNPDGTPSAGKILLVTEYGNALGIHPIVAINGIDIIEGNLTITPALMSGLVRENGFKLRIRTDGTGQALTATAVLVRADDPQHPFEVTWSMADAKAAGLDNKQNWKKYPRAMLKARAISEVCREGAEDVLMGAHYTPEEMGATVNESGEVIEDAEIVEVDHDPSTHNGKRAHAEEARVNELVEEHTPTASGRRGRSRPQEAAAGPALPHVDTRGKQAVHDEWASRIDTTADLDALIRLHNEAEKRGVLDTTSRNGKTVEDVFLAKRDELKKPVAQPVVEYDDETPF